MLLLALLATLQGTSPPAVVPVPTLSIVVNLPAYRLDLIDSGRVVARYPVAIGLRSHPTPTGAFLVRTVELNPSWTPPKSPWAENRQPMRPGPANPMGRVKMQLRPQYYLHGTPDSLSMGSAASHGCIRLRNRDALEIARRIIAAGSPALADSAARLTADSVISRAITLEAAIPVEVRYDVWEVLDGVPVTYPDVYRLLAGTADRRELSP